jgi:hypothetical protein
MRIVWFSEQSAITYERTHYWPVRLREGEAVRSACGSNWIHASKGSWHPRPNSTSAPYVQRLSNSIFMKQWPKMRHTWAPVCLFNKPDLTEEVVAYNNEHWWIRNDMIVIVAYCRREEIMKLPYIWNEVHLSEHQAESWSLNSSIPLK